ncbi:TPA: hypothetical protein ACX6QD_000912 [Photobacterium damselae]
MEILNSALDWLDTNKQWVFSGIGVTTLTVIIGLVFSRRTSGQSQKSGDNSTNYMAGGDINIINGLTREELMKALIELSERHSIEQDKLLTTREEVRKVIEPLFADNHTIFQTYGPMTEERFNPESELPEQWLRKVTDYILPNNRKIVETIESHRDMLLEYELEVFAQYKQHVDDFEAKHTGRSSVNGAMFPSEILNILR